jgi:iron-sulfur cluster insertion protein
METQHNTQDFSVSTAAAARISHLLQDEPAGSRLRVSVLGGGCSGFQYLFAFDAAPNAADDIVFREPEAPVVVDTTSLDLLKGAMLDYREELGSAAFVITNPNAKASCGCGNSFSIG